jgi:hypothetical protein
MATKVRAHRAPDFTVRMRRSIRPTRASLLPRPRRVIRQRNAGLIPVVAISDRLALSKLVASRMASAIRLHLWDSLVGREVLGVCAFFE